MADNLSLDFFTFVIMSMRKTLRSAMCTLITLVVFLLTISITFVASKNGSFNQSYLVSEDQSIPTGSDNQFPYEERETEEDDEFQDQTLLVGLLPDPFFFAPLHDQSKQCDHILVPVHLVNNLPLYLSKRVLLI